MIPINKLQLKIVLETFLKQLIQSFYQWINELFPLLNFKYCIGMYASVILMSNKLSPVCHEPRAYALVLDASQTSFKATEFTACSRDTVLINSHLLVGA